MDELTRTIPDEILCCMFFADDYPCQWEEREKNAKLELRQILESQDFRLSMSNKVYDIQIQKWKI